jgi:RNA polymerase sigma-70 factor (ECF subfamily)
MRTRNGIDMEIVINLSEKMSSRKMDESESDLLTRARQGREDALREIIEKHEHQVAATVTGILGSGPEVDDVGQQTFVQFFRSLHRFRGWPEASLSSGISL